LKVLEKSLNLNLANFEILHLLAILKQALVCMSPVLGNSICLAVIITVLVSTVQYTSVSHFQSKFSMSASRIRLFVDNFGA